MSLRGAAVTAPDPYAVLGVAPSASDEEVRAAYRTRSMLLHPDLHQGRPDHVRREAERAMTQLTEAYEAVLVTRRSGPRREVSEAPTPFYRLGRLAARVGVTRVAAEAGEQDGGFAYRLGWLVGRRRR